MSGPSIEAPRVPRIGSNGPSESRPHNGSLGSVLANDTVAVDALAVEVEEVLGTDDIAADETLFDAGAAATKEARRIAV